MQLLELKNKLARIWYIGLGLLLLFLIIMTVTQRFYEDPLRPWIWFGAVAVPAFLMVIAVIVKGNRLPSLLVVDKLANLTNGLSIVYLLLAVFTLLILPTLAFTMYQVKPVDSIMNMLYVLIPIQLIVIGLMYFLFFHKTKGFSGADLLGKLKEEVGEESYEFDYETKAQLRQECERLLVNDEVEPVLSLLRDYYNKQKDDRNEGIIINLYQSYNRVKKENDMGTINAENAQVEFKRIGASLFKILSNLAPEQ